MNKISTIKLKNVSVQKKQSGMLLIEVLFSILSKELFDEHFIGA